MLKDMFRVELNSAIHPCALMQRKKRRNKLRYRPHIRLTLKSNTASSTSTKTINAFDHIFISEIDSMRVSYFEIQVDDSPVSNQKNSGIELSIKNRLDHPKITPIEISDILPLIKKMGFEIQSPNGQVDTPDELYDKLMQHMNRTKKDNLALLTYCLKEPIFNATFKVIPDRGQANRLWIRSKCTKGQIIVDKHTVLSFDFGAELLIEFCSDYKSG